MFAPVPAKETQSQISLQFGQKITKEKTPIALDIVLDIFSQKNQNDRFIVQTQLGCQINDNTLLIEIQAKNGNGTAVADKIMTFIKGNKDYNKLNQQGQVQIKAVGKGESCYVFINSQKLSYIISQITNLCQQLQQQKANQPNTNHEIKLKIRSLNDCGYIRKLLDNQGAMRAFYDSLTVNFTFHKTTLVQKVLEKIFTAFQMQNILGPLKSFNNINLSLKFASASQMEKYPQLHGVGRIGNKVQTFFLTPVKGLIKDEVKFTYFNPVFSFWGKLMAQDAQSVLQALFEEPGKGQ